MIAIVGRPNVGKSALFNCILGQRLAIVHEESGVTRDRIVAPVTLRQHRFLLVDTGGLGVLAKQKKVGLFEGLIRAQVETVMREATRVVWVVDAQEGVVPLDHEIASLLRQCTCHTVLAANKADNDALREAAGAEFAELGFPTIIPTSCTHHRGIDDLLEACLAGLPPAAAAAPDEPGLCLAVVGRPNVGKSSLVNFLADEQRVIVSEVPGTTRDAIDVPLRLTDGNRQLAVTLVDTAGLRPHRRADTPVEFFSIARAERAIRRSDAVLLILDAVNPGTAQDRRVAHLVAEARKPCILVVNKWDLVSAAMTPTQMQNLLREQLPFMRYAPVEVVCALSGDNVPRVVARLLRLHQQMQLRIPTPVVNRFIQDVVARTPPPATAHGECRVYYATMTGNPPPRFLLFVNRKRFWPAHYLQFLVNRLQEAFFPEAGLPLWLELRERRAPRESRSDG
jgi:GTP-binding protein